MEFAGKWESLVATCPFSVLMEAGGCCSDGHYEIDADK
jgi:hypothetical protein